MNLEQQLQVAFARCEPGPEPLAAVMARLSGSRPTLSNGRRSRSGRIIVISTIVALAAVAGTLASRLTRAPAQISVALPAEPGPLVHADTDPAQVPAAEDVAAVQVAKPEESLQPHSSSFTVLVQTLQLETGIPAVRLRVQDYYSALLDELRAVPGLVLTRPETMGSAATTPADFRITVIGGDGRNSEFLEGVTMWQVTLRIEAWRDTAYRQEEHGTMGSGGTMDARTCWQGSGQPYKCGPAGDAARTVATLIRVFPSSPALDDLRARNRAEAETQNKGSVTIPVDISLRPGAVSAMDAKTISFILERIAAVPAPGPRAALWLTLRGQKYPEQLPLLLKALREETADVVRKEIITQLALDFTDDPAARAALVSVAAIEPQALSRHVAALVLSGDAPWRDYVVATVRDTSLPTAQRLDPLTWMMGASQRYPRMDATFKEVLPALLDGDGARVLAELLASKQKDSADPLGDLAGGIVVAQLSVMDHPAVPDLLVAWFDAAPSEIALRFLAQRRSDPRVRKKLEAIAAGDADPKLSQQAASFLLQAPASTQAAPIGN
jgi:hypothetical protein